MAKRTMGITGFDTKGKPIIGEIPGLTKAQKNSLTLIPFTPAPKTRWEKIKRNLI